MEEHQLLAKATYANTKIEEHPLSAIATYANASTKQALVCVFVYINLAHPHSLSLDISHLNPRFLPIMRLLVASHLVNLAVAATRTTPPSGCLTVGSGGTYATVLSSLSFGYRVTDVLLADTCSCSTFDDVDDCAMHICLPWHLYRPSYDCGTRSCSHDLWLDCRYYVLHF